MNKKIILITHTNSFGGAEKVLFWLAEKLSENSYEILIVNLNESDNDSDYRRTVKHSIPVFNVENGKTGLLRHINEINTMFRIIRDFKPNLLISFTRLPNAIAGLTGWLTRTPVIISERSDPRVWYNNKINSFLMIHAAELSGTCVFQTQAAKQYASRKWNNKSIVIPNPIFLPSGFVGGKPKIRNKTIVSLGRFDNYQKRYDVMIEGFAIFHKKHPDYKLRLFGSGEDQTMIQELVEKKGLTDFVLFMGLSTNPFVDIIDDGIYTITSDFEGIPNSLLEAMAMGLPVVATDCEPGGARMLITDHKDGIIVPRGDACALARAFCEFAESPSLAENCSQNAMNVVERFDPDIIFQQWKDCIEKNIT